MAGITRKLVSIFSHSAKVNTPFKTNLSLLAEMEVQQQQGVPRPASLNQALGTVRESSNHHQAAQRRYRARDVEAL